MFSLKYLKYLKMTCAYLMWILSHVICPTICHKYHIFGGLFVRNLASANFDITAQNN